jgi:L-lactate utilization protein LutC
MNFFKRLFGATTKDSTKGALESQQESTDELAIDMLFLQEFKKNKGKFIYCTSEDEIQTNLDAILEENSWRADQVLCFSEYLTKAYGNDLILTTNPTASKIFFTECEHLIANQGSVLVCSRQLKSIKQEELPEHLIILAKTSQIVRSISSALKSIKQRYSGQPLPTKITSFKNNHITEENQDDFMHYGSKTKNLYLLLLEDY